MKKLTTKVLNTFKRNGGNSVLYYAQNTKEHLDELNKAILELGVQNIMPQFMEAEEGFVAVEFVKHDSLYAYDENYNKTFEAHMNGDIKFYGSVEKSKVDEILNSEYNSAKAIVTGVWGSI